MTAVLVPRSSRLHQAAVTADTHKRYYNATRDFVHWAQQNKEEPANIEELDETLNEYIHWMFDTGGSKDAAYKALFGTMHFLIGAKNRSTFPFSKKSMRGWSKLYPPRAWSPLTWELCCAIAFQFVRAGRPEFAVAVLVAFDGMFRCGELLNISVGDLGMDESGHIGVRLPTTKTGPEKYARIRKPAVQEILRWWIKGKRSDAKLFEFSATSFRRAFRHVCDGLGLDHSYVIHSCRHGGATELFMETRDLHLVMIFGRWAVESSARHYVQDGKALCIRNSKLLSPALRKAAALLAKDIVNNLRAAAAQSGCGWFLK